MIFQRGTLLQLSHPLHGDPWIDVCLMLWDEEEGIYTASIEKNFNFDPEYPVGKIIMLYMDENGNFTERVPGPPEDDYQVEHKL